MKSQNGKLLNGILQVDEIVIGGREAGGFGSSTGKG